MLQRTALMGVGNGLVNIEVGFGDFIVEAETDYLAMFACYVDDESVVGYCMSFASAFAIHEGSYRISVGIFVMLEGSHYWHVVGEWAGIVLPRAGFRCRARYFS